MAIRAILCAHFCLICFLPLEGQQNAISSEKGNLYERALFATIVEMEKSWSTIDDTVGNRRIRTDYRHMIVEKDEIIEGLPIRFGQHEVEYLDVQELITRYRRLRKEFAILRIHPLRNDGEVLKILISVFWFKSKGKGIIYSFSDWGEVE